MYTDVSKPYLTLFLLTIYGVFNLDFFRYIIPHFCISSTMTALQVLSLEYIVAFYPPLLTIVLYICIQLHARDCRPLVYLWRPFHKCCSCLSQRWNPSESLVHAFAAFLLLSYSKILFVSFKLLQSSGYTLDSSGDKVGFLSTYYNASVPYFSSEHLPFAILALSVLAIFIVLPVLILLLYPTRLFQRCIGCCSTRWHALDAFVDSFQGYYKNGTNGTPDWRYFSGLYLIFRILVIGAYVLPLKYNALYRVVCYSSASLFLGLLQPYKEGWINKLDSLVMMLFSLGEFVAFYDQYAIRSDFVIVYVLAVGPLLYLIVYTGYKVLSQTTILPRCAHRCINQSDGDDRALSVGEVERDGSTDSEEKAPLLPKASDWLDC